MDLRHRVTQTWRFALTSGADERHAVRTADALRRMGADDELVMAGLLHDVAKPRETRIWHRIAAVVLAWIAPSYRARFANGDGVFARYLDHARRGAEEARKRGASDRVIRLIARHHDRPSGEDERRLHRADREAIP